MQTKKDHDYLVKKLIDAIQFADYSTDRAKMKLNLIPDILIEANQLLLVDTKLNKQSQGDAEKYVALQMAVKQMRDKLDRLGNILFVNTGEQS